MTRGCYCSYDDIGPTRTSLLFSVTYCTRDAIVLMTSIVLVTLLSLRTISNLCLWPYSLRLDFFVPYSIGT